jgi:hypothetical protein
MNSFFSIGLLTSTETAGNSAATLAEASAAFLGELESSLLSSQRALLARDLASLEQATREQKRLRRALEILWTSGPTVPDVTTHDSTTHDSATHDSATHDWSMHDSAAALDLRSSPALAAELRAAQLRVLHLARVQAALLAREGRWLTTLANLMAGPEAGYGAARIRRSAPGSPAAGDGKARADGSNFVTS